MYLCTYVYCQEQKSESRPAILPETSSPSPCPLCHSPGSPTSPTPSLPLLPIDYPLMLPLSVPHIPLSYPRRTHTHVNYIIDIFRKKSSVLFGVFPHHCTPVISKVINNKNINMRKFNLSCTSTTGCLDNIFPLRESFCKCFF